MKNNSRAAAIDQTAFECPHCGAFTTQYWFSLFAKQLSEDRPLPTTGNGLMQEEELRSLPNMTGEMKDRIIEWARKIRTGLIFTEPVDQGETCWGGVCNLHLSKCYNCKRFALWVGERLVDPIVQSSIYPNPDLPDDIAKDFQEAAQIVNVSPRGAAALLRLCVQKLCKHLGEKGRNINEDIASLVSKGLDAKIQKALDIVRLIGNEAVHPGTMDLRDDPRTANSLFQLVNAIAEQMISSPKHVAEMYSKLPQSKRDEIERRDGKAAKAATQPPDPPQ